MAKARKEIDKDSMYQKIMPSAMRSAPSAADSDEPTSAAPKTPPRSTPRKSPPKKAPLPANTNTVATETAAPPKVSMPTRKPTDVPAPEAKPNIVNVMELLIDEKMDIAMEKFHCCTCDRCRQDIAAMALNKLHPKYIVAEPEPLEAGMADKESNTQVTTALVQAILKVKANPKH